VYGGVEEPLEIGIERRHAGRAQGPDEIEERADRCKVIS
jgi:hypothetical protein